MTRRNGTSTDLWQYFEERSRSFIDRSAVSTSQGELSFGDLFRIADQLALALGNAGLREGNTVALSLPNSIAFVPAFLALTRLSATIALISPKYEKNELTSIAECVVPDYYLTSASLASAFADRLSLSVTEAVITPRPLEALNLIPSSDTIPSNRSLSPESVSSEGTAVIKFTSGTTEKPKGIILTVDNILAEAQSVVETLALTSEDKIYTAVPVHHSYGFDLGVLSMLSSGATLVLRDIFVPRKFVSEISDLNATIILGVPSMYRFIVESRSTAPLNLSHVRYLLSCTAHLQPDLIRSFHEIYGLPICQHYGSSETGAVTTHIPSEVLARPFSVGVCMKNVELSIRDHEGSQITPGVEGEIVVRSAAVSPGYVMGQPSNVSPFREGCYWTGDFGYMDDDGFLYIKGRVDEIINVGGHKVSPDEVIQVLESHPAVREAAVFGVKDAYGEEGVYTVVSLNHHASEKEILAYCRTRLSDYKVPRRVDIRDELPHGPSGKVNLRPEDLLI